MVGSEEDPQGEGGGGREFLAAKLRCLERHGMFGGQQEPGG